MIVKREGKNREVYLYNDDVETIDNILVKRKYYPTRSSFIRKAIKKFLKEELIRIELEDARKIAEADI